MSDRDRSFYLIINPLFNSLSLSLSLPLGKISALIIYTFNCSVPQLDAAIENL